MSWLLFRDRRRVLFTLVGVLVLGAWGPNQPVSLNAQLSTQPPATADSARDDVIRRVTAIADEFVAESFVRYPAQYPAAARHGELGDNSLAALLAWQQKEDRWLEQLKQIDSERLVGTPEWVIHGTLRERLEATREQRVCHEELWGVNHFAHWHVAMPALAGRQPVGTQELREQALSRFAKLPRYIDTEITNLRQGLRMGYSAPKVTVELTVTQLNELLLLQPEKSPFLDPARRDAVPEFVNQWRTLVAGQIHPAVERYRNFLRDEYLPAARETVGVFGNPNGAACYRAQVRERTSLAASPDELFMRQMRQLDEETEAFSRQMAKRAKGTSDPRTMLEKLFAEPASRFASREEAVATAEALTRRSESELAKVFTRLPTQKLVVEPIPTFQEAKAAFGQYGGGPPSGPAVFLLNLLRAMEPGGKLRIESLVFHEGMPGHHLEANRTREVAVHRLVGPLRQHQSAFREGWAIYATQLAYEQGLFSSDAARTAWLYARANGRAFAVAEIGMHLKGWSRQQAIDFLSKYRVSTSDEIESEVDRSIAVPAGALAYSLGSQQIFDLREHAGQALGSKFDLREFHDRVLEYGPVTLPMLREMIDRWIASKR
jgi:uncharacterized protein (DUF885 family)